MPQTEKKTIIKKETTNTEHFGSTLLYLLTVDNPEVSAEREELDRNFGQMFNIGLVG